MLACQCDVLVKEVRMYWCRGAPQDLGGLDDSQDELRAKEVPVLSAPVRAGSRVCIGCQLMDCPGK